MVSHSRSADVVVGAVTRLSRWLEAAASGRDSLTWGQAARLLRRLPFTISLFVIVVAAGIVTGTVARSAFPDLMQRFGWNLPALRAGHFYDLWVGLLFASSAGVRWSMVLILLLGVGSLEFVCGTGRAAVIFFTLGALTSVITALLLWPLDALGVAWVRPFLYPPDMGSSSASLVCWGAAVNSGSKGGWRTFLIAGTTLPLVALTFLLPQTYVVDHLVAFALGLLAGLWLPCKVPATSRTSRRG